jgi:hypothetical protein
VVQGERERRIVEPRRGLNRGAADAAGDQHHAVADEGRGCDPGRRRHVRRRRPGGGAAEQLAEATAAVPFEPPAISTWPFDKMVDASSVAE